MSHGSHLLGCSGGSDATQTVTQIHDMDSSSTSLLGLPNVQLEDEMQAQCIHKYWCFAMKFVSLWMHAYLYSVRGVCYIHVLALQNSGQLFSMASYSCVVTHLAQFAYTCTCTLYMYT